jgi:hypothetical protein
LISVDGDAVLILASKCNRSEVMILRIQTHADINYLEEMTTLHKATQYNCLKGSITSSIWRRYQQDR